MVYHFSYFLFELSSIPSHYCECYCIKCFENGNKNSEKCQKLLEFHNSNETKKHQMDNNLLF